MKNNKQGFTLIELLVVIAIIGLLSTLSIVALNQARARARDARRLADIKQIQTALEMYYNDNFFYPASVLPNTQIASNSVVYMNSVPAAPTPAELASCTAANNTYTYTAATLNSVVQGTYTLSYCLGAATGGIPAGVNTASPAGIR
jgi:prepilin-type N-terminal cleavage/methylation domain-containing protein